MFENPMKCAMAQNRVSSKSDIHVEGDVVACSHRGDMLKDLLCAFSAPELLGVSVNHRGGGANRGSWVQLVRLEDNLNRLCDALLSQLGDGIVKTALSYKAPWAHNVGPDFYAHKCNDR
jgi:hypothetical protein